MEGFFWPHQLVCMLKIYLLLRQISHLNTLIVTPICMLVHRPWTFSTGTLWLEFMVQLENSQFFPRLLWFFRAHKSFQGHISRSYTKLSKFTPFRPTGSRKCRTFTLAFIHNLSWIYVEKLKKLEDFAGMNSPQLIKCPRILFLFFFPPVTKTLKTKTNCLSERSALLLCLHSYCCLLTIFWCFLSNYGVLVSSLTHLKHLNFLCPSYFLLSDRTGVVLALSHQKSIFDLDCLWVSRWKLGLKLVLLDFNPVSQM